MAREAAKQPLWPLAAIPLALAAAAFASDRARRGSEPPPTPPAPMADGGPILKGGDGFVDRFGKLDPKRWSVSDGWRVADWMANDWRASQARFDGGLQLVLAANAVPGVPFSSGEVQSRELYGHGVYEAKMRAARGSGIVTGFFTYTGPTYGTAWDEIDVEILGSKPREALLTYFREGEKVSTPVDLGFDATQSAHLYAFVWEPGSIRWYIDGALVHEERGATVRLPQIRQKIMVSLWGSQTLTDWLGRFDTAALPVTATIECVAYSPDPHQLGRCG